MPNRAEAMPAGRKGSRSWAGCLRFKYEGDPGAGETGFRVWYADTESTAGGSDCPVWARWYADDGRPLLWRTRRQVVTLGSGDWLPLRFEIPLPPQGSRFLRFEIWTDADGVKSLLCVGFVPRRRKAADARETPPLVALQPDSSRDAMPAAATAFDLSARRIDRGRRGLLLLELDATGELREIVFGRSGGVGATPLALVLPMTQYRTAFVVPEGVLAAPRAEIIATMRDRSRAPARIRVEPSPRRPPSGAREVAVVLTSCGRPDLLGRTLDSFFAVNTYPLRQFIVVEDGLGDANAQLMRKHCGRNIEWLATEDRVGQIAAIDYAYAFVDAPYIFHMEDDWEFHATGFIERSLALLEGLPQCLQIWLRALNDTNRHPMCETVERVGEIAYKRLEAGYLGRWFGFSFNPGLRRKRDYDRIGRYGWHVADDPGDPPAAERGLSELYGKLGFHAAILADNGGAGYVRHIGFARRVAAAPGHGEARRRSTGNAGA